MTEQMFIELFGLDLWDSVSSNYENKDEINWFEETKKQVHTMEFVIEDLYRETGILQKGTMQLTK